MFDFEFLQTERTMLSAVLFIRRGELLEAEQLMSGLEPEQMKDLLRHMVLELAEHHPLCDSCLQARIYRYALGKVGNT